MHETSGKYKHKGSGIAVYLDQKYATAYKNESLCICTPDVEILTVTFSYNNHTHNILSIYRPPNGSADNFIETFETFLNNASSNRTQITVIRDFNFNLYNPTHKYVQSYLECIFSNGVHPIISRATHFQSLNPSCIDHILTNKIDEILCTGIIPYNISHHMFTFAILDIDELENDTKTSTKILCINEKSINGFNREFENLTGIKGILSMQSAKDSFHEFLSIFKELYDKWFVHEKNETCNHVHLKSDWITPGLAKSSSVKNKLYQNWRVNKNSKNWNIYVEYRRKLDILISKVKYDYYYKKI